MYITLIPLYKFHQFFVCFYFVVFVPWPCYFFTKIIICPGFENHCFNSDANTANLLTIHIKDIENEACAEPYTWLQELWYVSIVFLFSILAIWFAERQYLPS